MHYTIKTKHQATIHLLQVHNQVNWNWSVSLKHGIGQIFKNERGIV